MENNSELFEKQLKREQQDLEKGIRAYNTDLLNDKQRNYFSHTDHGIRFRNSHFERLKNTIAQQLLERTVGSFAAERHELIKSFLEVCSLLDESFGHTKDAVKEIKTKKGKVKWVKEHSEEKANELRTQEMERILDLLTHITLTAVLDNSMCPYSGAFRQKSQKDGSSDERTCVSPNARVKETIDELEVRIGNEFYFQLRLYMMSLVMDGYVKGITKFASKEGLANDHYYRFNVNRMIEDLLANAPRKHADMQATLAAAKAARRKCEIPQNERDRIIRNFKLSQAFATLDWNNANSRRVLGQFCLSCLLQKSGITAFEVNNDTISTYKIGRNGKPEKNKEGGKKITSKFCQMIVPNEYYKKKWSLIEVGDEDVEVEELEAKYSDLSFHRHMVMPPIEITHDCVGGFIGSHGEPLNTFKGKFDPSEEHLDFYNNQANVPFRVNPWMLELLNELDKGDKDGPIKLGSFKSHHMRRIGGVCARLDFKRPPYWDKLSKEEQKSYAISQVGKDKWDKTRRAIRDEYFDELKLKRTGIPSAQTLRDAQGLLNDGTVFVPVRFDFRGRVIPRVANTHYQSPDHGKALLMFDEQVEKDDQTEHWLLINMANHYGGKLDKQSFSERKAVMLKNIHEIKAVAEMLDGGYDSWKRGFDVLLKIDDDGGKCFQFAVGAREYYELYIAKTKTTTSIVVTVDCSTSGQQISSVWLKNRELAAQTNVIKNDQSKPRDLYGAVYAKLMKLMKLDGKAFTPHATERLDNGFGRALCKAAIQGAQYGSGTTTQHQAIDDKLTELQKKGKLTLVEDEDKREGHIFEKTWFKAYFSKALEAVCKLEILNKWFRELAEAAYEKDLENIKVPLPNGTISSVDYTPIQTTRIMTYGYGQSELRKTKILTTDEEAQISEEDRLLQMGSWRTGLCPNVTHMMDAQLIAMALHDFPHPFTSCHDSLGCHASQRMKDLRKRLLESFVEIARFPIFKAILEANNIQMDLPPINEWDNFAEEILQSEYFAS